jgi:hypothetical protein
MNRKESTPREKYKHAFRRFRQYGESEDFFFMHGTGDEFWRAAEYSWNASVHEVTGWTSRRRQGRFYARKILVLTHQELPF